jgi:hypothetical protein
MIRIGCSPQLFSVGYCREKAVFPPSAPRPYLILCSNCGGSRSRHHGFALPPEPVPSALAGIALLPVAILHHHRRRPSFDWMIATQHPKFMLWATACGSQTQAPRRTPVKGNPADRLRGFHASLTQSACTWWPAARSQAVTVGQDRGRKLVPKRAMLGLGQRELRITQIAHVARQAQPFLGGANPSILFFVADAFFCHPAAFFGVANEPLVVLIGTHT